MHVLCTALPACVCVLLEAAAAVDDDDDAAAASAAATDVAFVVAIVAVHPGGHFVHTYNT